MKASLATQKPDDSISRSRLMLFLSEGSEPTERPTIPNKLLPAIMKHFLLIRPRHNQKIGPYPPGERNHRLYNLEGWMDRVDERRILIDPGLRKHHIISNRSDLTCLMLPDPCFILVCDKNLG